MPRPHLKSRRKPRAMPGSHRWRYTAVGGIACERRGHRRAAERARRRIATLRALALALALPLASALPACAEAACGAWPGEPSPLPTVSSADVFLARWAGLRARELAAAAAASERSAPARANALWQHVRCLDPGSTAAAQGLERSPVVRVHRPDVRVVRAAPEPSGLPASSASTRPSSWWSPRRGRHRRVSRPPLPSAKTPPPPPDWTRADAALAAAEGQIAAAKFEAALASAERLRRELGRSPQAAGAAQRRARAEVVAATAQIALGREGAARKSFERALAADPSLAARRRHDLAQGAPRLRCRARRLGRDAVRIGHRLACRDAQLCRRARRLRREEACGSARARARGRGGGRQRSGARGAGAAGRHRARRQPLHARAGRPGRLAPRRGADSRGRRPGIVACRYALLGGRRRSRGRRKLRALRSASWRRRRRWSAERPRASSKVSRRAARAPWPARSTASSARCGTRARLDGARVLVGERPRERLRR